MKSLLVLIFLLGLSSVTWAKDPSLQSEVKPIEDIKRVPTDDRNQIRA